MLVALVLQFERNHRKRSGHLCICLRAINVNHWRGTSSIHSTPRTALDSRTQRDEPPSRRDADQWDRLQTTFNVRHRLWWSLVIALVMCAIRYLCCSNFLSYTQSGKFVIYYKYQQVSISTIFYINTKTKFRFQITTTPPSLSLSCHVSE